MADVVTSSDLRVFVHATELAHVRCPLPFAAASIRRLLARVRGAVSGCREGLDCAVKEEPAIMCRLPAAGCACCRLVHIYTVAS